MKANKRSPQSTDSKILYRIRGKGRGSVHVPGDFLDLGSREAVDLALHRLARKGTIRRLARGVYDFPKEHPVLGVLGPSAENRSMTPNTFERSSRPPPTQPSSERTRRWVKTAMLAWPAPQPAATPSRSPRWPPERPGRSAPWLCT